MRVFNYTGDVAVINGTEYDATDAHGDSLEYPYELSVAFSRGRRTVAPGIEAFRDRADSIFAIGVGLDEHFFADLIADTTEFLILVPSALADYVRAQYALHAAAAHAIGEVYDNLVAMGAPVRMTQALEDRMGEAFARVKILEQIVWQTEGRPDRLETVG
jgi:hypothetical protein